MIYVDSPYAAGKRLRFLPLGSVGIDQVVVDRIEVVVESGVPTVRCSGFVGGRVEFTRLIRTPARLSTVAILLTVNGFV